jgi:phosphate-selective porin OprO/OprP
MHDVENDSKNDKASFAGRTTLNFAQFMGNKDMVLHVGLAGFDADYTIVPTSSSSSGGTTTQGSFLSYRTPGRGLSNIFRAQIGGERLSSTGGQSHLANGTSEVKSQALGLETILAYKNFKFQGEFAKADFKASSGAGTNGSSDLPVAGRETYSLDTEAWYAEALWLATGEKYADAYKGGAFSSIKPINDFDIDNGKWGAWEFGLKYEQYKVDNMNANSILFGSRAQGTLSCSTNGSATSITTAPGNINGCESKSNTLTAGIKWILNPNARVLLNYSRTSFGNGWEHFDIQDSKLMNKEDILMVRTQYAF